LATNSGDGDSSVDGEMAVEQGLGPIGTST
jgi:hypothetical protein